MTPLQHYEEDLRKEGFVEDAAQRATVSKLDGLYHRLLDRQNRKPARGLLGGLMGRFAKNASIVPEQGLYMWGGVGRGKTYLMDMFFDCLGDFPKHRMHFHRFMQRTHHELKSLAGTRNPLDEVAARLASEAQVLCFDEFFVSDIGDAMILAELMDGLFSRGVTLVATSNIPPDGLYENGLQRQRFLPAIALVKEHTEVLNVDGGTDYRLRALEQAEIYHSPLDASADESLQRSFDSLIPEPAKAGEVLEIEGRPITTRYCADDVVWFDFPAICDGPRSANDYIELARIYHAVLVSNVPRFTYKEEDQARRFISLVDEFYDHNVKLILSAAAAIPQLYQGERLQFEFQRTQSRLLEMQSHEYLARTHRA